MFIKTAKLEQVLKKAYKGAGIHLERQGSRLIVATAYMYIEADIETMTNSFKAAVIKFAGELPEDGTALTVSEDASQSNIPKTHDRHLFERDIFNGQHFRETAFTYNGDKILQADDGKIAIVQAKEWAVYSLKDLGESEDDPDGWYDEAEGIICRNSTMVLQFLYFQGDDDLADLKIVRLP